MEALAATELVVIGLKMKNIFITFLLVINISQPALACLFKNEINKSDLDQYPIIAYLSEEEGSTYFCLYLKDEGNFSGLNSVVIDLISSDNETIFQTYLDIFSDYEHKNLYNVQFNIRNKNILHTKIAIEAHQEDNPSEYGTHTTIFVYEIKLLDISEKYLNDEISWKKHSQSNSYNDEKLDRFLKTKYQENREKDL